MMNELQKKILDIFKAVSKICKEHGITYYAIGGTAIGAVRHQGFIPWDDDLDIAIPIEQYDRFIEIARRELPEGLIVMTPAEIEHYASFFIKVVDTRTTLIENYAKAFPDAYYGVFVDIMPLAGVPAPGKERKRYLRMWKRTAMLNYCRRFPVNRMKTRARVAACRLLRPFHGRIPYHYFTDKMFEEYRKRPVCESEYTGYVWGVRLAKLTFDVDIFGEGKELPFEDTVMNCPSRVEDYLTQQFGDYMQLPPEEQRVSVHPGFVDLNTPFAEYKEGRKSFR